ncbi:MAG: DUF5979 domain-containing protein [Propionibacteriales bacterium]|nr:DUF5979 domain-containing protein [Propionibacteriales bacterium]
MQPAVSGWLKAAQNQQAQRSAAIVRAATALVLGFCLSTAGAVTALADDTPVTPAAAPADATTPNPAQAVAAPATSAQSASPAVPSPTGSIPEPSIPEPSIPGSPSSTDPAPTGATPTGSATVSGGSVHASAEDDAPTLSLNVVIANDGTPSWDADSAAGNDSSATNGIVRVNDSVTYRINYAVNGATGKNTTLSITFPQGMEVTGVPGFCAAGSTLLPSTAGTPTLPVTDATYTSLNEQVLTCVVGDKTNASESVSVTAKVLGYVPNGHQLVLPQARITAGYGSGQTATTTEDAPPTVTASSRLKWDVSKNGMSTTADSTTFWGPGTINCPWNTSLACLQTNYSLLIGAPVNGKGAMPATGDFVLTDDLSPAALYPSLPQASLDAMNADLATYGSRILVNTTGSTLAPASTLPATPSATDYQRDVRKSGTPTWGAQLPGNVSAPGVPATIRISGTDTTLRTFPTFTGSGTVAIPTATAYAVSLLVQLYTPVVTVKTFGTNVGTSWTLPTRNTYTNFTVAGLDGETQTVQPTWNDYRSTSQVVSVQAGFGEWFAGEPRAAGNMTAAAYNPSWGVSEGPAGGALARSGAVSVTPGQTVISMLRFDGPTLADSSAWSGLGCDTWDNSKLQLQAKDYPAGAGSASAQWIPSGGVTAVWPSGLSRNGRNATQPSDAPAYVVQYSATGGAGSGNASTCTDAQGPWYDSPSAVPGNDPTLAAQGIYSAVSRVRVWTDLPVTTSGQRTFLWFSIGLHVADTGLSTGDILPNWASVLFDYSARDRAAMLADGTLRWSTSTFNASTNGGAPGDRLIAALGQTRITDRVRKGTTDAFTVTPPEVTGGDTVQFQLSPTLTSASSAPAVADVWVEDCLPSSLNYAAATRTPNIVAATAPADAKITCPAGTGTYVRWVIQNAVLNAAIDPIILSTTVAGHATDGAYTSTAGVWSASDASAATLRKDTAGVQVSNVAGVTLDQVAASAVVQLNRPGQTHNQPLQWTLSLLDRLPESGAAMSDPDVIDILPTAGADATAYNGSLEFVSASITAGGSGTRVLYTSSSAVNADPADTSNGSTGSTTWCDAASGGIVVSGTGSCPTSASEVTALRVQRPGPYAHGDTITVQVTMDAIGDVSGDRFSNRTFARVVGVKFPVGPIVSAISVTSAAVSGTTWWDLNRNGVQDETAPASGVSVRLTGTDDLGNIVDVTAVTDASGTYRFAGLRSAAGDYTVSFARPSGVPKAQLTSTKSHSATDATDSDADSDTAEVAVAVPSGTEVSHIAAGFYADGSLQLRKQLQGAGFAAFGVGDTFDYSLECTDAASGISISKDLTITAAADGVATSDQVDQIPAGSTCVITELAAAHADSVARPLTVVMPLASSGEPLTVVTDLTSTYSAGQVSLTGALEAPRQARSALAGHTFVVRVTCQSPGEPGARTTLVDREFTLSDATNLSVTDPAGNPTLLPVGTRCFATQADVGEAASVRIDHNTYDDAAIVTTDPSQVQTLSLRVVNVFACTATLCPARDTDDQLAFTGTAVSATVTAAVFLLSLGAWLRRRGRPVPIPVEKRRRG